MATASKKRAPSRRSAPKPAAVKPVAPPAHKFAKGGYAFELGDRSDDVKILQALVGAKPDGVYGPATQNKVRKWQAANGMRVTGKANLDTVRKMFG